MSFLALLEPEIPYPLDVTGKNYVDVFLALMVAIITFLLCIDVVEVMVVRMVSKTTRSDGANVDNVENSDEGSFPTETAVSEQGTHKKLEEQF